MKPGWEIIDHICYTTNRNLPVWYVRGFLYLFTDASYLSLEMMYLSILQSPFATTYEFSAEAAWKRFWKGSSFVIHIKISISLSTPGGEDAESHWLVSRSYSSRMQTEGWQEAFGRHACSRVCCQAFHLPDRLKTWHSGWG